MLFNSYIFLFAFLPVTYVVFWALRTASARYVWLALTGYVFYGYWDARFCLLMAFTTTVSFTAGLGFRRFTSPLVRKLCLVLPITLDLLLLGFFKYANFFLTSLRNTTAVFGWHTEVPLLEVILPIGISFYTFHTITYIVDCYRGAIKPTNNIFEFAAYVSLFSQLVAGPIVRFRQIEQDLESLGQADRTRWLGIGIAYFIWGLCEKVIVADSLASFVDPALAQSAALSTAGAWLAMLGYTFQLYFDFCGYSDMAVGLGYLFGLRIPINFDSPYKAVDPSDFWKRWHISLSTCLRDYLYIPLGGNRRGELTTYRNLLLTMLIGGLWHGAAWTFIIWGGYHGLLLLAHHRFGRGWDALPWLLRRWVFFVLIVVGWVFFRATDLSMAGSLLTAMFTPTSGILVANVQVFLVVVTFAAWWAMSGPNAQMALAEYGWKPAHGFVTAALLGLSLAIMAGGRSSPFLYFQF
jgi:alginate O-acetyltransferase complex protein AlgI